MHSYGQLSCRVISKHKVYKIIAQPMQFGTSNVESSQESVRTAVLLRNMFFKQHSCTFTKCTQASCPFPSRDIKLSIQISSPPYPLNEKQLWLCFAPIHWITFKAIFQALPHRCGIKVEHFSNHRRICYPLIQKYDPSVTRSSRYMPKRKLRSDLIIAPRTTFRKSEPRVFN